MLFIKAADRIASISIVIFNKIVIITKKKVTALVTITKNSQIYVNQLISSLSCKLNYNNILILYLLQKYLPFYRQVLDIISKI